MCTAQRSRFISSGFSMAPNYTHSSKKTSYLPASETRRPRRGPVGRKGYLLPKNPPLQSRGYIL